MEAYRIDRFGSVDARRRHIRRTNDQFVGGYAEYALVEAGKIAPKPAALDYIRAAGLPVVAVTAWQMLFEHARIELGQAVLVRGGAGSVGACATQMAMEAGASVYGTARARDLERVRCGQRDPGGGRRRAAGDRPAQPAARHHGLQHLRPRGRKPAAQARERLEDGQLEIPIAASYRLAAAAQALAQATGGHVGGAIVLTP